LKTPKGYAAGALSRKKDKKKIKGGFMKKIDGTITTVQDILHALKDECGDTQLYIYEHYGTGTLTEVVEIVKILPKVTGEKPYIVLRCQ
jgi:hypothetical protein